MSELQVRQAPDNESRGTEDLQDKGQREAVEDLHFRRNSIRSTMGGQRYIDRLHREGRLTVRERIDLLCDEGSFVEVGTFVVSERDEDRLTTPGDGKIGGHATINGRAVTVVGDDVTVKRGSTATMGSRRYRRLFQQAVRRGNPFIVLGESAGARIPDTLGALGLTELQVDVGVSRRMRRIPMITVITGDSYGGSSFAAAQSDVVIQIEGSCMSITSPRLIEMATGERVSTEELGGLEVHQRITGQVDIGVATEAAAMTAVAQVLSYLPQNSTSVPERLDFDAESLTVPGLADLVPSRHRRGYDMRRVIRALSDSQQFLELQPQFGRSLVTCLTRLGGFSVGVIANQPKFQSGALDPDACTKAIRFICLCEAFNIPILFLQDVPGFMVGRAVEHGRLLSRAITLQQALALSTVPKLTVVLRKAYGLAYYAMGGIPEIVDALYAWPNARFGFMDERAGAQVVRGIDLTGLSLEERHKILESDVRRFDADFDVYIPAQRMRIDEVIDPADTRRVLVQDLERLAPIAYEPGRPKPLMSWPTR